MIMLCQSIFDPLDGYTYINSHWIHKKHNQHYKRLHIHSRKLLVPKTQIVK